MKKILAHENNQVRLIGEMTNKSALSEKSHLQLERFVTKYQCNGSFITQNKIGSFHEIEEFLSMNNMLAYVKVNN